VPEAPDQRAPDDAAASLHFGTTEQTNHGGGTVYRFTTVAEPGPLGIAGLGVAGVIAMRRQQQQQQQQRRRRRRRRRTT